MPPSMPGGKRRWPLGLTFAGASLAAFVGLTAWLKRLPALRGSAWTLKDLLVRVGAVVAGVVFVLSIVFLAIPVILDRLEGGALPSFIAARHVRAKKSGFLTLVSVLSIFAVAVGWFSLSSAISVMGGFSAEMKRKILGNNAHIVIDTTS